MSWVLYFSEIENFVKKVDLIALNMSEPLRRLDEERDVAQLVFEFDILKDWWRRATVFDSVIRIVDFVASVTGLEKKQIEYDFEDFYIIVEDDAIENRWYRLDDIVNQLYEIRRALLNPRLKITEEKDIALVYDYKGLEEWYEYEKPDVVDTVFRGDGIPILLHDLLSNIAKGNMSIKIVKFIGLADMVVFRAE